MYIYFKRSKSFWTIADVVLKHGYTPHIGNISPDDLESNKSLELEPAIWFKCLLIDSLLIDCDCREVRWTRRSLTEWNGSTDCGSFSNSDQDLTSVGSDLVIIDPPSPRSQRISSFDDSGRQSYDDDGGEIYDSDCVMMEELFDEVHEVLEEYMEKNLFSGCKNFHVILFRILHCYILPKIILTKDDIPLLRKAQSVIEEELVAAESDIEHGVCGFELANNSLKSLRNRFVEEFQNDKTLAIHEPDFLKILLKHLENDIECMEQELNCTQNKVNRTKEELEHSENKNANNSSVDASIDDSLKDIRLARNQIHKQAMKLKFAKEHIRNQILCTKLVKRKRVKGKAQVRPLEFQGFQASYIMLNQICQEKTAKMEEVYLKKLKIISVREAIRSSLDDLKEASQTLGVQMKSDGSEHATDIFAKDSKNVLWMTSEERIGRLVTDPRSKIRDECVRFCKQFNERVDGIFSEDSFLTISESSVSAIPKCNDYNSKNRVASSECNLDPFLTIIGNCGKERRSARIPSFVENYYSANDVQSLKQKVEQMKNEIIEHIQILALELSRTMKVHNENKLRVCYEGYFYPRVMNQLYRLYEASCYGVRETLTRNVPGLSPIDLSITEPWVLILLSGGVDSETIYSHPDYLNKPEIEAPGRTDITSESGLSDSYGESGIGINMDDVIPKIDFSRCSVTEMYKAADLESAEYSNLTSCSRDTTSSDGTSNAVIAPVASESGSSIDSGAEDVSNDSSVFSCFKKPSTSFKIKSSTNTITRGGSSVTRDSIKYKPKSPQVNLSNLPDFSGQHETFCELFKPALDYLKSVSKKDTVLSKLKLLTRAFRFINTKISALRSTSDAFKGPYMPCCDDMLTLCIILLTQLSGEDVFALFVNLTLMIDLMAPCLNGGVHDCSLINFHSAFQYIIDRSMLLRNKKAA